MTTRSESDRRFLETVSSWLVSLPHDLKVLFEAKDDPNLDRPARETAAGAILSVLGADRPADDFGGFAGDTILVREALRAVLAQGGEGAAALRERFPEAFDSLEDDLAVCREVMGDVYEWLESKIEGLGKLVYKGKTLAQYIDDDEATELLYDDGLAFQTDYGIDEELLEMKVKKVETLLEPLRRKMAAERQKIA